MDSAVALVQAYLHVNGYFTVLEYPIFQTAPQADVRTVTDLDILAFRFPGAGREVSVARKKRLVGDLCFAPDPRLGASLDRADMIVGEIKEGRARFNAAARNPHVLAAALSRFGCCAPEHIEHVVQELLRKGKTITHEGHTVRLVAFGSQPDPDAGGKFLTIPTSHVVRFLKEYLRTNWDWLHLAPIRQPALGLLALLEKAGEEKVINDLPRKGTDGSL